MAYVETPEVQDRKSTISIVRAGRVRLCPAVLVKIAQAMPLPERMYVWQQTVGSLE